MRTQARGLAEAIADKVVEHVTAKAGAWNLARLGLGRPEPFPGFEPPWPDVLISCGRRSIPRALDARRRGGDRPFLVHIQDPRGAAPKFDFVVAMAHEPHRRRTPRDQGRHRIARSDARKTRGGRKQLARAAGRARTLRGRYRRRRSARQAFHPRRHKAAYRRPGSAAHRRRAWPSDHAVPPDTTRDARSAGGHLPRRSPRLRLGPRRR